MVFLVIIERGVNRILLRLKTFKQARHGKVLVVTVAAMLKVMLLGVTFASRVPSL